MKVLQGGKLRVHDSMYIFRVCDNKTGVESLTMVCAPEYEVAAKVMTGMEEAINISIIEYVGEIAAIVAECSTDSTINLN